MPSGSFEYSLIFGRMTFPTEVYKIPINGVIYPSIQKAAKSTKTKSIGLIGTQATISSNAYVIELYNYSENATYLTSYRDISNEHCWQK